MRSTLTLSTDTQSVGDHLSLEMAPLNTLVPGQVDKAPPQKKKMDESKKDDEIYESLGDHKETAIMTALRRRIASSEPKTKRPKRKHRHLVVEQHYRIDKENRALLPGVPRHDKDLARDIHDFFNLIFLVPIVLLNVLNWNWDALANKFFSDVALPLSKCWTGEYFYMFYYTTISYFVIDLMWVLVVPNAVRSTSTIVQHHIASLLYLMLPLYYENVRFLFGVCMSVELNTWFLIARRVFNKQGFPAWTIDLPFFFSVKVKLISISFYVTWIVIRCMIYPYVLVLFYDMIRHGNRPEDEKIMLSIAACLHSIFCLLNARWTMDLINKKIRQWKTKSRTISDGL